MSTTTPCPNDDCENDLSEGTCTLADAYLAMGDLSGTVICHECEHRIVVSGNMRADFDATALESDSG